MCALAFTQFHKVYFDYNLLNMQSKGMPAVEFERKLIDKAGKSVLFAAVIAPNAEKALELDKRIRALPSVATNDMMAQFITGDQSTRLEIIGQVKHALSGIRFGVGVSNEDHTWALENGTFFLETGRHGFQGEGTAVTLHTVRNAVGQRSERFLAASPVVLDVDDDSGPLTAVLGEDEIDHELQGREIVSPPADKHAQILAGDAQHDRIVVAANGHLGVEAHGREQVTQHFGGLFGQIGAVDRRLALSNRPEVSSLLGHELLDRCLMKSRFLSGRRLGRRRHGLRRGLEQRTPGTNTRRLGAD